MVSRRALAVPLAGLALVLAACVPETEPAAPPQTPRSTASAPAVVAPEIEPFPLGHTSSTTPLPDDCRDVLTDTLLAELDGHPLNAPGMGGGIQPDSTRVCVWGEPGAVATWLVTVIGYSPERDARDALYTLGVEEGFTCYEPSGGIRCERTWEHETLPIERGRTVFWRDGVVVDTQYSNLAPAGYTSAIIAAMWPPSGQPRYATPTPTPTSTPTPTP